MPLTGWIMSSARGFPVSWFSLYQLPDLVPKSRDTLRRYGDDSRGAGVALALTVALHIAGALKHHFVLKDDTLRRMLPFGTDHSRCGCRRVLAPAVARAAGSAYTRSRRRAR